MAKTASLKTIALRALKDPKSGAATRLVALRAAKPYLDALDYEQRLRQLADTSRSKVLRLLLAELTEIDAARRARSAQDESAKEQRTEVDEILRQCEAELAAEDGQGRNAEAPKSTPAIVERSPLLEPQPTAPAVPQDGVLSVPVNGTDDERAEGLKRGHDLAAAILMQLEIMSHAPLNWHAGQKKLEQLQGDFLSWERAMRIDYPDMDTQKEFPDARLRVSPKIIDARTYQAHRRVLTLDEALAVPPAKVKPVHDDGFWSCAGPGI